MLGSFKPSINPDNRFKLLRDSSDCNDIIINSTVIHTFNLPFAVEDFVDSLSLTYRQGFDNVLTLTDYNVVNKNTVEFKLETYDTSKFKKTYLDTYAQLKVITKAGDTIFSEPKFIKVFKPIQGEMN